MATVELELIDGNTGSSHIINGWAITIVAIVTDLDIPSGGITQGGLYLLAIAEVSGVLGPYGSACPGVSGTYLESFIPEVLTPDICKIRVVYKGYPATQIEIGTSLTQVESNKDSDGTVITVQYAYPATYALDPRKAGKTITQGGMISKPVSDTCLTFKYTVASSQSAIRAAAQGLSGKVNAGVWSMTGDAAHTWMCQSYKAVSRDGGFTWEVTIVFQYREDTWDFFICFINPDDGKPPNDLVAGTGYKNVPGLTETLFPSHIP